MIPVDRIPTDACAVEFTIDHAVRVQHESPAAIARLYAEGLASTWPTDWDDVHEIIRDRWDHATLCDIVRQAVDLLRLSHRDAARDQGRRQLAELEAEQGAHCE